MALGNLAEAIESLGVTVEWPMDPVGHDVEMGIDRTRQQILANRRPLTRGLPPVILAVDVDGHRIPGRRAGGDSLKIVNVRTNFIELATLCPGYDRNNMKQRAAMLRENLESADAVVTSSRHTLDQLRKHSEVIHMPHVVMPNAIDEKLRTALASSTTRRDRIPLIVAYGKGLWRKDFSTALRASVRLRKRGLDHRFKLLTYGSQLAEYRHISAGHQAEHISIRPTMSDRSEMADLLRRAWSVCHTAIQEDFGNVFLEAAAAGTPVVATKNAISTEHGIGPPVGILAPARDIGAFSDALAAVIEASLPSGPSHEPLSTTYSSLTWRESAELLLELVEELQ